MIKLSKQSESKIHYIQVEQKSDLDKIESTFDCYTDNSITDELILDTARINECEDSTSTAIAVFGEKV